MPQARRERARPLPRTKTAPARLCVKRGQTLREAFCGVWIWAQDNLDTIERARDAFDQRKAKR
ncbi:hypothetical protein [Pseudomonas sp. PA15(2017)]|uniref:hypothetical protein n=1 Tax=Pseudomonas sp. PA15(2017) TaxID=1932111 RepID=UPI0015A7533E|nr:hypothetical protein [Pseudomonas sp. PA15(2017)]